MEKGHKKTKAEENHDVHVAEEAVLDGTDMGRVREVAGSNDDHHERLDQENEHGADVGILRSASLNRVDGVLLGTLELERAQSVHARSLDLVLGSHDWKRDAVNKMRHPTWKLQQKSLE